MANHAAVLNAEELGSVEGELDNKGRLRRKIDEGVTRMFARLPRAQ